MMRTPSPHFVLALTILLALVLFVWMIFSGIANVTREQADELRLQQKQSLPDKCAVYYDDGTDRWKECMGVGLK